MRYYNLTITFINGQKETFTVDAQRYDNANQYDDEILELITNEDISVYVYTKNILFIKEKLVEKD